MTIRICNPHFEIRQSLLTEIKESVDKGIKPSEDLIEEYKEEDTKMMTWRWTIEKGDYYIKTNPVKSALNKQIKEWNKLPKFQKVR